MARTLVMLAVLAIAVIGIGLLANAATTHAQPTQSKIVLSNGTTTVINNYYDNGMAYIPFYYMMFTPQPYYGGVMQHTGNTYVYAGQQVRSIEPQPLSTGSSSIGTLFGDEQSDTQAPSTSSSPFKFSGGDTFGGENDGQAPSSSQFSGSGGQIFGGEEDTFHAPPTTEIPSEPSPSVSGGTFGGEGD